MTTKKLGKINIVMDLRLSRQKTAEMARIVSSLRQFADVQLTKGDITEDNLLADLKSSPCTLLLLPSNFYLEWKKIEGYFGLTRTSGPTVAGYHFGQLLPKDIGAPDLLRVIFLDFAGPPHSEVIHSIRCLMLDVTRSGLSPLLSNISSPQLYYEDWNQARGLGNRIDCVMKIPELTQHDWSEKASSIRVVLGAFWGLIYEDGPGKAERNQTQGTLAKRAYFQVGANSQILTFRLFYSMPQWTPKDIMTLFWPDPTQALSSPQLLLEHADFVRVHWIAENQDIEITVGFYKKSAQKSAGSERVFGQINTLWIEPLSARLVAEPPYERPETHGRNLRVLSPESMAILEDIPETKYKKELEELNIQIKELRKALHAREELISELKEGGVGSKGPQNTFATSTNTALDVFREHFLNHHNEVRATEEKILRLNELSIDLRRASTLKRLEDELFNLRQLENKWCDILKELVNLGAEKSRITKKVA